MLTFDGQLCTLIKNRCEKENDTGIYRLTAVNSMGQAESTCQVVVQSNVFHERLQSKRLLPVFTQSLEDKTIREGEQLLFQIRVNGQSKPQIIWYKDNQPLRNTNDYKVYFNNKLFKNNFFLSLNRFELKMIFIYLKYQEHPLLMLVFIKLKQLIWKENLNVQQ